MMNKRIFYCLVVVAAGAAAVVAIVQFWFFFLFNNFNFTSFCVYLKCTQVLNCFLAYFFISFFLFEIQIQCIRDAHMHAYPADTHYLRICASKDVCWWSIFHASVCWVWIALCRLLMQAWNIENAQFDAHSFELIYAHTHIGIQHTSDRRTYGRTDIYHNKLIFSWLLFS